MRLLKTILLLTILFLALYFIISVKAKIGRTPLDAKLTVDIPPQKQIGLSGVGEKITYTIKLGKLNIGRAIFHHTANKEIERKLLSAITFETRLANFKDKETIYADPETLLPIRIERDILNLLIGEKITELYDQTAFSVTINKKRLGMKESLTIKKTSPIQNAILLPQFIRHKANLEIGETLNVNLPKHNYEIKLTSIENITVPAGTFKTYHFESTPKQIEIWISTDENKIPVKIQGTNGLGYIMVLKDYIHET